MEESVMLLNEVITVAKQERDNQRKLPHCIWSFSIIHGNDLNTSHTDAY